MLDLELRKKHNSSCNVSRKDDSVENSDRNNFKIKFQEKIRLYNLEKYKINPNRPAIIPYVNQRTIIRNVQRMNKSNGNSMK